MSPDRCRTHHICDCRQARMEAAYKEVERLGGQLKDAYKLYEVKADQIIREKKKDATIVTLRKAVRTLTASAKKLHGPFHHAHIKDEKACRHCRLVKKYEALTAAAQEAP